LAGEDPDDAHYRGRSSFGLFQVFTMLLDVQLPHAAIPFLPASDYRGGWPWMLFTIF
jgi:aminoglycoside phosphotransferase (APT) family kinase protein